MASAAARCALGSARLLAQRNGGFCRQNRSAATVPLTVSRTAVTTASGAILPKPVKTSFGLLRTVVVVLPFLYVGTLISKHFAALLEEHDIFVPEDDDDDD
ncbi:essential MCU regulator, mitochondrial [Amia ocellicauda]|uniref:essential MCU regulator, mitochondrial n=1 Tax=Amia ocellicauda TaxID=2972642 RepID=UPI003463A584|nr:EMRE protein [Amia calva]